MAGIKKWPKMKKQWGVWEAWWPPGSSGQPGDKKTKHRQNEFHTEAEAKEFLASRKAAIEKQEGSTLVRPHNVYACLIKKQGDGGQVLQLADGQFEAKIGVFSKEDL